MARSRFHSHHLPLVRARSHFGFFAFLNTFYFPMEVGSVLNFLEDKTILIVGATGFLAKSMLSLSLPPSFRGARCELF